uniref:Uncharacterized protein n=1 Tax=Romanomermis culicivorax TaxID=13658 RepID=A0A915JCI7_ROMCU
MLVCESRVNPDHFYLFKKKEVKRLAIGSEVMYFECVSCNSHGNPMGRATVREGREQSNRDHGLDIFPPKSMVVPTFFERKVTKKNLFRNFAPDSTRRHLGAPFGTSQQTFGKFPNVLKREPSQYALKKDKNYLTKYKFAAMMQCAFK